MRDNIKKILRKFGVGVISSSRLDDLVNSEALLSKTLEAQSKGEVLKEGCKAQLFQDIFVLLATNFKERGYFVEFGATNGVDLSNTYLLEKSYQWTGILAEPEKKWHKELEKNRSCKLEFDCVWHTTGELLKFKSAKIGEFSTIASYSEDDKHSLGREGGEIYDVKTISLADMLYKHGAPKHIDYLSIDTEGSEFDILNGLDFSLYDIAIIHVEHNFVTEKRALIYDLLSMHGYKRRYQNFSKWDDWYYRDDLILNTAS